MDDFEPTLTVAIELDDELGLCHSDTYGYDGYDSPTTSEVQINAPPSASSLVPDIPSNVHVRHLKRAARELIQLRLNPPPLGSMRNWEFVATQLGLDNDRIFNLQCRNNPTEDLLNLFADQPLKRFMASIADSNRIDLLISLQPHLRGIQPQKEELLSREDSGLIDSSRFRPASSTIPEGRFIVVTHCTPKTKNKSDEELYKMYKWFFKNTKNTLATFAAETGTSTITFVDINDFLKGAELSEVEHLFRKAWQIIVVCTPAYKELMESDGSQADRLGKLKRYFHKNLMDAEYVELGRNERFRPVTLQGASEDVLLNGWQKNTLVHEFPSQFEEFVLRVFKQ